jgi:hypothetical protein
MTTLSALAAVLPMDVPVGWSDPKDVDMVHALLVLGGIPLLLFVAILTAVYLPAVIRGERIAPGQPPVENQWIGGPRKGVAELSSSTTPASDDQDSTGGASGRW